MSCDALASLLQSDLREAVVRGVSATALFDRDGAVIAHTGRFDIDDVDAIAVALTHNLRGDDVANGLWQRVVLVGACGCAVSASASSRRQRGVLVGPAETLLVSRRRRRGGSA